MTAVYRVLAYLIALEVVVQASAIAYAVFGLGKWIDGGGVLDKAAMENRTADFPGVGGFALHGMNGQMIIPAIALLLLISSFFAKVPRGVIWALIVVVLVALQIVLGLTAHGVPALGPLHGINALAVFTVAVIAGWRARTRRPVAEKSAMPTAQAEV